MVLGWLLTEQIFDLMKTYFLAPISLSLSEKCACLAGGRASERRMVSKGLFPIYIKTNLGVRIPVFTAVMQEEEEGRENAQF